MVDDSCQQLTRAVKSQDWPAAMRAVERLERAVIGAQRQALAAEPATHRDSRDADGSGERYLVTGGAGFIGSHLARRLLALGHRVVVFDEFNDYYDPVLKWDNVADLLGHPRFKLLQLDIRDIEAMRAVFAAQPFDVIVHLAARAGVRPSILDPQLYVTSNVLGTQNLLELAREYRARQFVYASSSSVYGGNTDYPFSESQNVDHPISPYAATKKANELQAACYARLYGLPVSGLRFFTVYGPCGRPDMAVRMFVEKLDRGEPITLYGDGGFERDFTYIDDIVQGILGVVEAAAGRKDWCEVFNLGESDTTTVRELILLIAKELGLIEANAVKSLSLDEQRRWIDALTDRGLIRRLPEQLGDVPKTYANVEKARTFAGYNPQVKIAEGIRRSVEWHQEMKRLVRQHERERLRAALGLHCTLRLRAGLDSFGRWKDPEYTARDAEALCAALTEIEGRQDSRTDPLALGARGELAATLGAVAAYLGGFDDPTACRIDGLVRWRKQRLLAAPPAVG